MGDYDRAMKLVVDAQQLILNCSLAQDATEVEILLLHLDVKGND
jgi:hypothetical protein